MGLGQSIVSELNVDSLKMNHPTPSAIVQPMTGGDSLCYVVYRFLMAIYMFGTVIYGVIDTKQLKLDNLSYLHFPVWGYFAGTLQSILMAYSTLANYYAAYKAMSEATTKQKEKRRRSTTRIQRRKRMTFSASLPKMPKIYVMIWVTYYIMLYTSLMTIIMYQAELFQGRLLNVVPNNHRRTITQMLLHQVFFGYCLLDFCLCGIPVRLLHFYVMTTYAIVYQLTLLVTTLILKMNAEKYRPIYNVADVDGNRLILCCSYFVGFSFITPVAVHIIYYCLFLLKSHLIELYFRTTRVTTKKPSQKAEDATGEHDEYGAEKAAEWTPGAPRTSKIMPISEQEEAEINSLNKEQSPSNNSIALVDLK